VKEMTELYNKDYYEEGVAKGISGYTNYHFRPEYVLPLANSLKSRLFMYDGYKVLDYGCAKGFLVKAFRLLGVEAYGYDISKYAIETADESVKAFVSNTYPEDYYNLIIAKDTLEHVSKEDLPKILKQFYNSLDSDGEVVIIVPLGDNGLYRIREYELDKTHIIREDEEWWIKQFNNAGFNCDEFHYSYPGAKDHWLKVHPFGNGTFILGKKNE
jgi:SAM-dependent methyltransferase